MQLTVVVALLTLTSVSSATAADGELTMEGRLYRAPNAQLEVVQLRGTVPNARAGERIEILAKECLYEHYRVVGGTQTFAGGRWETEVPLSSASSIVARWRGRRTAPFKATPRVQVFLAHAEGSRQWKAGISAFFTPINFNRRFVELQRLSPAGWVRVRRARLHREEFGNYTATFVVRTRGLTMRVLAPGKTTRPCFRPGASEIFRS